jgi:hypothetical protein
MHRVLMVIGVAVVAAGLILALVPLFDGPSQVLTPSHTTAAFNATTTLSLSPDWTIGLTWASNQNVSLLVVVCRSIEEHAACPGASYTVLNGTAGAGTFSVPVGGTLLVGIVSSPSHGLSVIVQLKPALLAVGTLLVIVGAATTLIGVFLPRTRRPSATSGSNGPRIGGP